MTSARAANKSRDTNRQDSIPTSRLRGRPLLLLLDIDGTLAPIATLPSLAQVPDDTRRILATLTTTPEVYVVLVSGRGARDARAVVGVDRVWTIGNHGAETLSPNGDIEVDPDVARYAPTMAIMAARVSPLVATINGAMVENKTWTLSVHYRAANEEEVPRLRGIVETVASQLGLRVTAGKKLFEVRPPVPVDKGTAIARLIRNLGGLSTTASILYAGDDVTDEDGFRYLRSHYPNAVTIHVGDEEDTQAEFRVDSVNDIRELLASVLLEGERAR